MTKKVWTTTSMREDNLRMFELSFPNKFDYPEFFLLDKEEKMTEQQEAGWKEMNKVRLEIKKQIISFKKIDPNIIPKVLYAHSVSKNIEFLNFCRTLDGDIIIPQECANLLKRFRIGETAMYPLSFYDLDLNEPVNDKTYYFLNIVEWRHYLLPEFSNKGLNKRIKLNDQYESYRLDYSNYKDDAIAVSEQAVACDLDLWHDPALSNSIFVSDELKQALDDAGMGVDWLFYQCQLVCK